MTLRQWDIVKVRVNPQDRDEHPAIILSPTEVASDERWPKVNVLYGTTKRPAATPRPGQIILDEADGCDHLTVFDRVFFPVVRKDQIRTLLGRVSRPGNAHWPRRSPPFCASSSEGWRRTDSWRPIRRPTRAGETGRRSHLPPMIRR